MRFVKFAILGAAFSVAIPAAFADSMLYGDISVSGSATFTGISTGTANLYPNDYATKIAFKYPNQTPAPAATSGRFDQSQGQLVAGDGDFSIFDTSQSTNNTLVYFTPNATSQTKNANNQFTGRSPAFLSLLAPSTADGGVRNGDPQAPGSVTFSNYAFAPIQVFTVRVGTTGPVLRFYLTDITETDLGLAKTTGTGAHGATRDTLSGDGYVTINGVRKTDGTFTLAANSTGSGLQAFSATFTSNVVTPEPSSLALLGTGMMGIAGFVSRKRGVIQQ